MLKSNQVMIGAECAEDAKTSTMTLRLQADQLRSQLAHFSATEHSLEKAHLQVELGYLLLQLADTDQAWDMVWPLFDDFAAEHDWEGAIRCCDILFQCDRPDESLIALGHGIWLAVTYPVALELSLEMLNHLIEDSPDDSDGAAVAAATALYLVDVRAGEDKAADNWRFFANQMLGNVARRHGQVQDQTQFDAWIARLELNEPGQFLPRLSQVVEVLVHGYWRIDRDALQAQLPDD